MRRGGLAGREGTGGIMLSRWDYACSPMGGMRIGIRLFEKEHMHIHYPQCACVYFSNANQICREKEFLEESLGGA